MTDIGKSKKRGETMKIRPRDLDIKDFLTCDGKKVCVSTISLPFDHGWDGPPLWYETMIFAAKDDKATDYTDLYCERYSTEDEAVCTHDEIVRKFKAGKAILTKEATTMREAWSRLFAQFMSKLRSILRGFRRSRNG